MLAGAGAAGIGIARLIRLAMLDAGLDDAAATDRAIVLVDSQGLVHEERTDLDEPKRELALAARRAGYGFSRDGKRPGRAGRDDRARQADRPGRHDRDRRHVRRRRHPGDGRARTTDRSILPLSNPTSRCEAHARRRSCAGARAAPWSPRARRSMPSRSTAGVREIGQANNVFVFPGLGLGAIAAEARTITPRMFLLAARALAGAVSDERLAIGALYPAGRRPARGLPVDRRPRSRARRSHAGRRRRRSRDRRRGARRRRDVVAGLRPVCAGARRSSGAATARRMSPIRAAVLRRAGRAGRHRTRSTSPSRAPARSGCASSPPASAIPTSTCATATGRARLPIAMGHEGAGVVEAVGPGVRTLSVGQPVALSWLVPCGVCRSCRGGRVWACVDSPSFRHRMPDGATVLDRVRMATPVLSYCGIGDDGRGHGRPRGGRDRAARRRGSRRWPP